MVSLEVGSECGRAVQILMTKRSARQQVAALLSNDRAGFFNPVVV
jgi:hypothetical protein